MVAAGVTLMSSAAQAGPYKLITAGDDKAAAIDVSSVTHVSPSAVSLTLLTMYPKTIRMTGRMLDYELIKGEIDCVRREFAFRSYVSHLIGLHETVSGGDNVTPPRPIPPGSIISLVAREACAKPFSAQGGTAVAPDEMTRNYRAELAARRGEK